MTKRIRATNDENAAPAAKKAKTADSQYNATAFTRSGRAVTKPRQSDAFVDSGIALDEDDSENENDEAPEDNEVSNDSEEQAEEESDAFTESEESDEDPLAYIIKPRPLSATPELPDLETHQEVEFTDSEDEVVPDQVEGPPTAPSLADGTTYQIVMNIPEGPSRQIILNIAGQQLQQALSGRQIRTQPAEETADESGKIVEEQDKDMEGAGSDQDEVTSAHSDIDDTPQNPETVKLNAAGLFAKLPPELRNKIYRYRLMVEGAIDISAPSSKCDRSAALLRSCKLIHEEATSVLYGANHFYIDRREQASGGIYDRDWKELGYVPARQFLKTMGPLNVSLLRTVTMRFFDAPPRLNPHLPDIEDRRFIYDHALRSCFRQLIRHGRLAYLKLDFQGRSRLHTDEKHSKFLNLLCRIRVDTIDFGKPPYYRALAKHTNAVTGLCRRTMQREQRLYGEGVFEGVDDMRNGLGTGFL